MTPEVQILRDWWEARSITLDGAKDAIWAESGAWDARVGPCLDLIVPAIKTGAGRKGARILDLGCGVGRLTLPLARIFPRATIVGVDVSPGLLAHARTLAEAEGVKNVEWILCDGEFLPASVGRLTAAFSMITFQHMPLAMFRGYLLGIAAALRAGAVLRFQYVEGSNATFLSHNFREADVRAACTDAGLTVEAVDPGGLYEVWRWVTATKPKAPRQEKKI